MNISPAIMTKKEVAQRFRRSPQTLDKMLPELEHRGFPKKDALLGGWPVIKVEDWLAKRFNVENDLVQQERALLERLNGQIID